MLPEERYCDCTKVPFSPECVDVCIEHVLRTATIEEKQLILGIGPTLAHNIKFIYQNRRVYTFEDLAKNIRDYETDEIRNAFKSLTQYQLDYFNKSQEERRTIIEAIKRLDLGSDENMNSNTPVIA